MKLFNSYEDAKCAEAYARLEFPGTYYLAYRDLPDIISEHVRGRAATDFGCGAGRSARFLKSLGFDTIGVDISENMINKAREADPEGDYHLIGDGGLSRFEPDTCDLVLSAFTFDNIPTMEKKVDILGEIRRLLRDEGRFVSIVSAPEIYVNEWASFSTRDFPENRYAQSGDTVRIIITDMEDKKPIEDVIWTDEAYQECFVNSGLELVKTYRPLARDDAPCDWVSETRIAPWVIYVLKRA